MDKLTDESNELDQYGVWVKTPGQEAANDNTESDLNLPDFSFLDEIAAAGANLEGISAPEPAKKSAAPADTSSTESTPATLGDFITGDITEIPEDTKPSEDLSDGDIALSAFIDESPAFTDNRADGEVDLSDFLDEGEVDLEAFMGPDAGENAGQKQEELIDEEPLDIDLTFDDTMLPPEEENVEVSRNEPAPKPESSADKSEMIDLSAFMDDTAAESAQQPASAAAAEAFDTLFESGLPENPAAASTAQAGTESETIDLSEFGMSDDTDQQSAQAAGNSGGQQKNAQIDYDMSVSVDDETENPATESQSQSDVSEGQDISLDITPTEKAPLADGSAQQFSAGDDDFDLDSILNSVEDVSGATVSFSDAPPKSTGTDGGLSSGEAEGSVENQPQIDGEADSTESDGMELDSFIEVVKPEVPSPDESAAVRAGESDATGQETDGNGFDVNGFTVESPVFNEEETEIPGAEQNITNITKEESSPDDFSESARELAEEIPDFDEPQPSGEPYGNHSGTQPEENDTAGGVSTENEITGEQPEAENQETLASAGMEGETDPGSAGSASSDSGSTTPEDGEQSSQKASEPVQENGGATPSGQPDISEQQNEDIPLEQFITEQEMIDADPTEATANPKRAAPKPEPAGSEAPESQFRTDEDTEDAGLYDGVPLTFDETMETQPSEAVNGTFEAVPVEAPEADNHYSYEEDEVPMTDETFDAENMALLKEIAGEINNLKEEINSLKIEFEALRRNGTFAPMPEQEANAVEPIQESAEPETQDADSFEADGDTALSDDELKNILDTSEFKDEEAALDNGLGTEEAALPDAGLRLDFENETLEEPVFDEDIGEEPETEQESLPPQISVPKAVDVLDEAAPVDLLSGVPSSQEQVPQTPAEPEVAEEPATEEEGALSQGQSELDETEFGIPAAETAEAPELPETDSLDADEDTALNDDELKNILDTSEFTDEGMASADTIADAEVPEITEPQEEVSSGEPLAPEPTETVPSETPLEAAEPELSEDTAPADEDFIPPVDAMQDEPVQEEQADVTEDEEGIETTSEVSLPSSPESETDGTEDEEVIETTSEVSLPSSPESETDGTEDEEVIETTSEVSLPSSPESETDGTEDEEVIETGISEEPVEAVFSSWDSEKDVTDAEPEAEESEEVPTVSAIVTESEENAEELTELGANRGFAESTAPLFSEIGMDVNSTTEEEAAIEESARQNEAEPESLPDEIQDEPESPEQAGTAAAPLDEPETAAPETTGIATEEKDENTAPAHSSVNAIPEDLKEEIKSVLTYMDQLLENLPEEKIAEFAQSEQFETYKRLFNELGLS